MATETLEVNLHGFWRLWVEGKFVKSNFLDRNQVFPLRSKCFVSKDIEKCSYEAPKMLILFKPQLLNEPHKRLLNFVLKCAFLDK